MFMSHQQTTRQVHNVNITNKLFQNVVEFGFLWTTVTDQKCINEEIKDRLNVGYVCYCVVHNLSSSSFCLYK